jgi:integrase
MAQYKPFHIGGVQCFKRGKYWRVRYSTPDGRIDQSLKVTNRKVAEQKVRAIDDLLESGDYATLNTQRSFQGMTFGALLDDFRANFTGWSTNTWRGYGGTLARLEAEFGERKLAGITARDCESFLARLHDQDGRTVATTNRYLAALKTLWKTALRWGYTAHNPVDKITIKREQTKIPEPLTEEELERLVAHLPPYAQPIVIVAAYTGLRREELFSLEWRDVDLQHKLLRVRISKNDDFRIVPLLNEANQALTALKTTQSGEKVRTLRVFPFVDIKKSLAKASQQAGIGHVHLHRFRHTFATLAHERGFEMMDIMKMLGHRSPQMVMRYLRVRDSHLLSKAEQINSRQSQPPAHSVFALKE